MSPLYGELKLGNGGDCGGVGFFIKSLETLWYSVCEVFGLNDDDDGIGYNEYVLP